MIFGAFLPPLWFLAIAGEPLIGLLYDPRYADAGWILRILAIGAIGTMICTSQGNILLAAGDGSRFMLLQGTRGVLLLAGMWLGWHSGGLPGLVAGISLSRFLDYPVLAWGVRRHGLWMPGLDLLALLTSVAIVVAGWAVLGGPAIPGASP